MIYDQQYLHYMYNATSTEDESGKMETYKAWLERQLISRMKWIDDMQRNTESGTKKTCPFPFGPECISPEGCNKRGNCSRND